MKTKLTLRLDNALIARAKTWCDQRGLTLSQAVAALFSRLPAEDVGAPGLTPWTRQWIGLAGKGGSDAEVRDLVLDRALWKHR